MKGIIHLISGILIINQLATFSMDAQSIDIKLARQYFSEAKSLTDRDNGNLWGINLYGPLVFVNEESREGVANFPAPEQGWKEDHGLYYGKMPENMGFANTALDWNGQRWSMIIFSHLPEDQNARGCLMIHELFHQHEQKLGMLSEYNAAKHFDQKMARVTLFLEWNALLKACQSDGKARNNAIQDALSFRANRFKMYPDAKSNETGKELHEGVAEYTGMTLSGWDNKGKVNFLKEKVADRSAIKTMVWTFAYVAGPLYGYLLDQKAGAWTRKLKAGDDLGQILSKNYKIPYLAVNEPDLAELASPYGYDSIYSSESTREAEALALQTEFRRIFTENPVLFLAKKSLSIQFDPGQITPYDTLGTVYGTLSAQDAWGKLKVTNSKALLLEGWKGILVPVGASWNPAMGLEGPGWKLELDKGYKIARYRDGWQVIKQGL
jgi:hypothetical protein